MSTQNKLGKIITRFEISFDNETKVEIDSLKGKLDEVTRALSVKNDSHGDRLLAAMQAEAANDAPRIPFLKKMGQWVFEGQDEKWVSAAKDADNEVWLFQVPLKDLATSENKDYSLWYAQDGSKARYLCDLRSSEDWKNSAIDRETVNDVDYLSGNGLDECVPHIDDVLDQPNWLSGSVPQITQADMQLIFIKNLSETLIQRMHSMDRFSEDDYAVGSDKLIAWDILIYEPLGAYAILMRGPGRINVADLLLIRDGGPMADAGWNTESEAFATLRTITEAELPAFRAALEACYA